MAGFLPRWRTGEGSSTNTLALFSNRSNNSKSIEESLDHLCAIHPQNHGAIQALSSETFNHIERLLRLLDIHNGRNISEGPHPWYLRPRTYAVLRNIDAQELMTEFAGSGFNDLYLPYSEETLPSFVTNDLVRKNFLLCQQYVLTNARALEIENDEHLYLSESATCHFETLKELGHGGFG